MIAADVDDMRNACPIEFYDHKQKLRMGVRSIENNITLYPRSGTITDIVVPDGYKMHCQRSEDGIVQIKPEGSRYTYMICSHNPSANPIKSTVRIMTASAFRAEATYHPQ
jgi:hypothetical protein